MTNSMCDVSNPKFTYNYCPSYGAAVLFAVLFSLTTAFHVYQAFHFRKLFAAVLIMGGLWEVLGYMIRTISIHNPYSSGLNTGQMLLILLAPLWINAFIYMVLGRMIHFFLEDDRVFGIKARKITLIFVLFDFTAFVVQGTGGSISSSDDLNTALTGLHIYTGGVALQIAFNAFFLAIVGKFHRTAYLTLQTSPISSTQPTIRSYADCFHLLKLTYGIVILILFRNFYRLAEFSSGVDNSIIKHEVYQYIFDAVPMLAALIILNIWYPSRKLQGERSDFSEETKARKQAKKERKEAKKIGKEIPEKADAEAASKKPFMAVNEFSGHESA